MTDLLFPSNLTLINATPFVWYKVLNESSQMVQWDSVFPDEIQPGDITTVSVEFTAASDQAEGDGTITYSLGDGTDDTTFDFSFLASTQQNPGVSVDYLNTSNVDSSTGSNSSLGWSPDAEAGMPYILSGLKDVKSFSSTDMPRDWMHQNLATIGCQPLRRLCMPGSHDSGMSSLNGGTLLVTEQNTLTHWVDVAGQLDAGFRYFDLRPVIASGQFMMGHYSKIGDSWVGGNGQSLADIISQVNAFLATNNELVILDMSHMFNTDEKWRSLNNDEMNRLLSQLEGLDHRYSGPTGANGDLSILPLNNFIANGPSVVVLSSDGPALPAKPPAGIFPGSAMSIYNSYANTPFGPIMKSDQLKKMSAQRKSRDDKMFLLSWTLTTVLDIRELSKTAHNMLFDSSSSGLWNTIYQNRQTSYPNILYIDGIGAPSPSPLDNRNVAAMSMAVNHAVLQDVTCPA